MRTLAKLIFNSKESASPEELLLSCQKELTSLVRNNQVPELKKALNRYTVKGDRDVLLPAFYTAFQEGKEDCLQVFLDKGMNPDFILAHPLKTLYSFTWDSTAESMFRRLIKQKVPEQQHIAFDASFSYFHQWNLIKPIFDAEGDYSDYSLKELKRNIRYHNWGIPGETMQERYNAFFLTFGAYALYHHYVKLIDFFIEEAAYINAPIKLLSIHPGQLDRSIEYLSGKLRELTTGELRLGERMVVRLLCSMGVSFPEILAAVVEKGAVLGVVRFNLEEYGEIDQPIQQATNFCGRNFQGKTLLQIAMDAGRFELIDFLVEQGADLHKAAKLSSKFQLYDAIQNGEFATAVALIWQGADIQNLNFMPWRCAQPLVDAIMQQAVIFKEFEPTSAVIIMLERLLKRGVKITYGSSSKPSPLSCYQQLPLPSRKKYFPFFYNHAVKTRKTHDLLILIRHDLSLIMEYDQGREILERHGDDQAVVLAMINAGAINAYLSTAVAKALTLQLFLYERHNFFSFPRSISLYIFGGADPNSKNENGATPLNRFVNCGDNTSVNQLVSTRRVPVHCVGRLNDGSPASALVRVARGGRWNIFTLLLKHLDLSLFLLEEGDGRTLLHQIAAMHDDCMTAVWETLDEKGLSKEVERAALQLQDKHGNTPLHVAALNNHIEGVPIFSCLLMRGAHCFIRNKENKTPIDLLLHQISTSKKKNQSNKVECLFTRLIHYAIDHFIQEILDFFIQYSAICNTKWDEIVLAREVEAPKRQSSIEYLKLIVRNSFLNDKEHSLFCFTLLEKLDVDMPEHFLFLLQTRGVTEQELESYGDINRVSVSGVTALQVALVAGKAKNSLFLMEKGADVNFVSRVGPHRDKFSIQLLMENESLEDSEMRNVLFPLLDRATDNHFASVFDQLTEWALLGYFAEKNNLSKLILTFEMGSVQEFKKTRKILSLDDKQELDDALYVAVSCGHTRIAAKLIYYGANPNAKFSRDKVPLDCAVEQGDVAMAKLLLESGALANRGFNKNFRHPQNASAMSEALYATFYEDLGRQLQPVSEEVKEKMPGVTAITKVGENSGSESEDESTKNYSVRGSDDESREHSSVSKTNNKPQSSSVVRNAVTDPKDIVSSADAVEAQCIKVYEKIRAWRPPALADKDKFSFPIESALFKAVLSDNAAMIDCLLTYGEDIQLTSAAPATTLLHYFVALGKPRAITILLDKIAERAKCREIIRLLHLASKDVKGDTRDKRLEATTFLRLSPKDLESQQLQKQIEKAAREAKKAAVRAKNTAGETPFDWLFFSDQAMAIVKILCEAGMDEQDNERIVLRDSMHRYDIHSRTALMAHREVFDLKNYNLTSSNELSKAMRNYHLSEALLLLSTGALINADVLKQFEEDELFKEDPEWLVFFLLHTLKEKMWQPLFSLLDIWKKDFPFDIDIQGFSRAECEELADCLHAKLQESNTYLDSLKLVEIQLINRLHPGLIAAITALQSNLVLVRRALLLNHVLRDSLRHLVECYNREACSNIEGQTIQLRPIFLDIESGNALKALSEWLEKTEENFKELQASVNSLSVEEVTQTQLLTDQLMWAMLPENKGKKPVVFWGREVAEKLKKYPMLPLPGHQSREHKTSKSICLIQQSSDWLTLFKTRASIESKYDLAVTEEVFLRQDLNESNYHLHLARV